MVNKKKVKTTTKKEDDGEPELELPPKMKLLTDAQLAGVVLLSLGMVYLREYRRAVHGDGTTNACATYVQGVDACTEADVSLIRFKYFGAITTMLTVASAMCLSWKNESLLQRLCFFLGITPLLSTIYALKVVHDTITPNSGFKFAATCFVLLIIGCIWLMLFENLAKPIVQKVPSLADLGLAAFFVVHCKDAGNLLNQGAQELLREQPNTLVADTLIPFIVVDQFTISGIVAFGLFFMEEAKKRSMLICMSLIQLVEYLVFMPKMEADLVHASTQANFLLGGAIFCLATAFAPKITNNSK